MESAPSPPPPDIAPLARKTIQIGYENAFVEPGSRRHWWINLLLLGYLIVVAAMVASPAWIAVAGDRSTGLIAAAVVAPVVLCGLAMLAIPVRVVRHRPVTRRSIMVPILASGFLLGGLITGGGFALAELLAPPLSSTTGQVSPPTNSATGSSSAHPVSEQELQLIVAGAVSVWIAWSILFIALSRKQEPDRLALWLHRLLISGSILELIIAVPSHIIVRRRQECCAGALTGLGICIGVAVALVSFGPALLLLYYRRFGKISQNARDK